MTAEELLAAASGMDEGAPTGDGIPPGYKSNPAVQ